MRQAIEEGFILDVLQNYTPYKLAFKLAHDGKELRRQGGRAQRGDEGDHGLGAAAPLQHRAEGRRSSSSTSASTSRRCSTGKAKAMVVVGSRVEAVRWQLAIDKYIKEQGYTIGTLVAFSGEVNDKESGPDPFTETQPDAEPEPARAATSARPSSGDEYQILLVANKFQTGFDQPLLCGMYVDKRLAGIQAVQTLSRLNRAHPGKDTTYVLDFVNDADEVLAAFKTYYETAELADDDRPEPGLRPARQARRRRALRRLRGGPRRRGGTEPERQAERPGGGARAGRGSAAEAVQGRAGGAEGRDGEGRRRRPPRRRKDELDALRAVQARHGRVRAALHVPVADLRLRQHRHREAGDLLSGACSRCWSSAASARGSTSRRWC